MSKLKRYPHADFRAVLSVIQEWDGEIGTELRIGDADDLAHRVLDALPDQKIDFTDAAEITRAIAACNDPIKAACTVIGLAAGVIEHHASQAVARQFLIAAAERLA